MTIEELRQKIVDMDSEGAVALTEKALAEGYSPTDILNEGVTKGLSEIGEKFERCEYFLPELQWGSELAQSCIALLRPHLSPEETKAVGKVVIATVSGDLHNIGKDLVALQLSLAGFEVHNLGIDQKAIDIINKAREVQADIIGLSALMMSTMPYQAEVIGYLQGMGVRDQFKVIVGGGPTTKEWAEQIGADGWGANAVEAVRVSQGLVASRKEGAR